MAPKPWLQLLMVVFLGGAAALPLAGLLFYGGHGGDGTFVLLAQSCPGSLV
jgi:hypothetical protein